MRGTLSLPRRGPVGTKKRLGEGLGLDVGLRRLLKWRMSQPVVFTHADEALLIVLATQSSKCRLIASLMCALCLLRLVLASSFLHCVAHCIPTKCSSLRQKKRIKPLIVIIIDNSVIVMIRIIDLIICIILIIVITIH